MNEFKPLDESLTEDELYEYFIKNIYFGNLVIENKCVKVFVKPFNDNKMQSFFHITTKTVKKKGIYIRLKQKRAYFINFIPLMINDYNDKQLYIKSWWVPYKNTKRLKLLYSDSNYSYIIILQPIDKYMYIISAYLIDGGINSYINEYNKYTNIYNNKRLNKKKRKEYRKRIINGKLNKRIKYKKR